MYKTLGRFIDSNPALHGLILVLALAILGVVVASQFWGTHHESAKAVVIDNVVDEGTQDDGWIDTYYPKVRFQPPVGKPREAVLRQVEARRDEPWPLGEEVDVVYSHTSLKRVRLVLPSQAR